MSRAIKISKEIINKAVNEFKEALVTGKFADGKISYSITLGNLNQKANVYFTEIAWLKMQTLIDKFNSEVGWHGIATRYGKEEDNAYLISDILVYPQEVTGVTVTTDQEKYEMWLMQHDDDTFNNIRMQGHSHVNMSTSPSSVDNALYEKILDQLDDDMFYIFMIWNKSGSKTIKIYDMEKNVMFDTADISVKILDDGTGIEKFLKEAKELVDDKKKTSSYTNSTAAKNTQDKAPTSSESNKTNIKQSANKGSQPKYKRKESYSGYSGYYGYSRGWY